MVENNGHRNNLTPVQSFALEQAWHMISEAFSDVDLRRRDDEFFIVFSDHYLDPVKPLHAVGSEPKVRTNPVPDGGDGLAVAA